MLFGLHAAVLHLRAGIGSQRVDGDGMPLGLCPSANATAARFMDAASYSFETPTTTPVATQRAQGSLEM